MPLFSSSFHDSSQPAPAAPEVDPLDNPVDEAPSGQQYRSAYPPDGDSPFHEDEDEDEDAFDLHDEKFRRKSSSDLEGHELLPPLDAPSSSHIPSATMPEQRADKPLLDSILQLFPLSNTSQSPRRLPTRTRRESRAPPPNHARLSTYRPSPLHHQTASKHSTPTVNEPSSQATPSHNPPIRTSLSPSRAGKNQPSMDIPSSPNNPLRARPHPSPSRHHGLSALSSLQGLSPMPSASVPLPSPSGGHSRSVSGESEPRAGGHSRSGSVTRSLSRRQSLYHNAAEWGAGGKEYADENLTNPTSLFSRLTLVKAPASEQQGLRRRSKSSSALAPIAMSQSIDIPATSPRAPRRSFASSFNTFSPITPLKALPVPHSPGGPDAVHRISTIYSADNEGGRTKSYTPDEVVELARGLSSPVLMPEGGFKGAELKRRKSAGASFKRSPSFTSSLQSTPEQHPPTALEPVEYVQLDDDCLLPFVDRPAEVAELMKHPSNEKMFTLLRATFPKDRHRKNWQEVVPEEWNWEEFKMHLTGTDRIECPDYDWIFRARQAVRQRSVALWEKVGVCLGCDDRLLNAGGEDGAQTWGGLEDDEQDDQHRAESQVWIEGLAPVDPDEGAKAEKAFAEGFGEIVEDDEEASAGMTALLGRLGEEDGTAKKSIPALTTAQKAGSRYKRDPLISPINTTSALPPSPTKPTAAKSRTKSFVGLTIISSSGSPQSPRRSPSMAYGLGLSSSENMSSVSSMGPASLSYQTDPTMDRDASARLFPSGFATLSYQPPLGRAASVLVGGLKPAAENQFASGSWAEMKKGLRRKQSGTGLSESAITFASESEYAHSSGYHD